LLKNEKLNQFPLTFTQRPFIYTQLVLTSMETAYMYITLLKNFIYYTCIYFIKLSTIKVQF